MTPRRQRMLLVLFILAGTATTAALTVAAFRQNLLFFYTPSQIIANEADTSRIFRLGGLVMEDSLQKSSDSIEVRFAVTDTSQAVTVSYRGVLPDLFREGQGVVVRGKWQDEIMIADEVLAKHDENYMPPEVQDAIDAARTLRQ